MGQEPSSLHQHDQEQQDSLLAEHVFKHISKQHFESVLHFCYGKQTSIHTCFAQIQVQDDGAVKMFNCFKHMFLHVPMNIMVRFLWNTSISPFGKYKTHGAKIEVLDTNFASKQFEFKKQFGGNSLFASSIKQLFCSAKPFAQSMMTKLQMEFYFHENMNANMLNTSLLVQGMLVGSVLQHEYNIHAADYMFQHLGQFSYELDADNWIRNFKTYGMLKLPHLKQQVFADICVWNEKASSNEMYTIIVRPNQILEHEWDEFVQTITQETQLLHPDVLCFFQQHIVAKKPSAGFKSEIALGEIRIGASYQSTHIDVSFEFPKYYLLRFDGMEFKALSLQQNYRIHGVNSMGQQLYLFVTTLESAPYAFGEMHFGHRLDMNAFAQITKGPASFNIPKFLLPMTFWLIKVSFSMEVVENQLRILQSDQVPIYVLTLAERKKQPVPDFDVFGLQLKFTPRLVEYKSTMPTKPQTINAYAICTIGTKVFDFGEVHSFTDIQLASSESFESLNLLLAHCHVKSAKQDFSHACTIKRIQVNMCDLTCTIQGEYEQQVFELQLDAQALLAQLVIGLQAATKLQLTNRDMAFKQHLYSNTKFCDVTINT